MENEYKFRQCPKDKNIQCRYMGDKCGICPIAESAPKRRAVTNAEYIRGLDDKGLAAFFNAAIDDIDVLKEQCNLCRYSDPDGCLEAARHKVRDISAECDKATWRWLHDEARALADAVEEERRRILK